MGVDCHPSITILKYKNVYTIHRDSKQRPNRQKPKFMHILQCAREQWTYSLVYKLHLSFNDELHCPYSHDSGLRCQTFHSQMDLIWSIIAVFADNFSLIDPLDVIDRVIVNDVDNWNPWIMMPIMGSCILTYFVHLIWLVESYEEENNNSLLTYCKCTHTFPSTNHPTKIQFNKALL